jgi:hypothetical protein
MRSALLLALLVGCSSRSPVSPAPAPATPPPSAPPAASATVASSISELAYFVGRWRAEARDPSSGKQFQLDYTVAPALRGAWLTGSGSSAELDLELHDLWGKDPVTGEIVRTIFDSARTLGTVRSRGWTGDVLVLEGTAATTSGSVTVRETIRRIGPDEFHAVWEARTGETWSPYSIETLRRQPPR